MQRNTDTVIIDGTSEEVTHRAVEKSGGRSRYQTGHRVTLDPGL